jgi:NADH-quinone oxidoreductase subunit C
MSDDTTTEAAETAPATEGAELRNEATEAFAEDAALAALGAAELEVTPDGTAVTAWVERENYLELMGAARDAGFDTFVDLCAVDYFRRRPRFEVVVILFALEQRRRLLVKVGVPGDDPTLDSLTSLWPGANFYEREAYDLFGIHFSGHLDLTRILLPDDWEGHPLRKDYAVGSVPVQFKGAHQTP